MDLSHALQMVSRSDAGMVRSHNEDAILANAACGLAILADGMGGYNAGEVASGMAISLLGGELERAISAAKSETNHAAKRFDPHVVIAAEIVRTNAAIYEAAQSQSLYAAWVPPWLWRCSAITQ